MQADVVRQLRENRIHGAAEPVAPATHRVQNVMEFECWHFLFNHLNCRPDKRAERQHGNYANGNGHRDH